MQGQTGTSRDKQGQTGTFPLCPFMSLLVPVCPCLFMLVPACPCLSLSVPVCPFLSLSVTACLYICYTFMNITVFISMNIVTLTFLAKGTVQMYANLVFNFSPCFLKGSSTRFLSSLVLSVQISVTSVMNINR